MKSAAGIGGLLALGIGDTLRVTLTADPVEEVYAARDILKAIGLRREEPDLVACPTCGRTRIDLIPLAQAGGGAPENRDKAHHRGRHGLRLSTAPARHPPPTWALPGGTGRACFSATGRSSSRCPRSALLDELMALIEELP